MQGWPPHPRARILLVDDHADTTRSLARLLLLEGYDVTSANRIEEAVGLCEGQAFDLLVTDLELGDGDGSQLLKGLRERCGGIRAVAITGHAVGEYYESAQSAGFEAILVKPFSPDRLIGVLGGLVGGGVERVGGR